MLDVFIISTSAIDLAHSHVVHGLGAIDHKCINLQILHIPVANGKLVAPFDLLFGLEEHVGNGQEILLYGITPELIAAHPELKNPDPVAYAEVVHAAGGLVYQAHPYRCAPWILCAEPLACLDQLDGIEVHNAGNHPQWNEQAQKLADERGLSCTAGSDGHGTDTAGRSGIATRERIRTNEDLVRTLKSGDYTVIR